MAKKTKPAKEDPKAPDQPLVLGVAVRGELADIPIIEIDNPPGPPDRMARPDDAEQIAELARSIREVGQVQPVMVEKTDGSEGGRYIRVFGRRRIAAAKVAGLTTVRAIVVPPLELEQRRTIVAVENIQRKNLSPIEEHMGVWELCEMAALEAGRKLSLTSPTTTSRELLADRRVRIAVCDTVAGMLAKTPMWVRDRMYIGRLGKEGRRLVLEGKLPLQHAREIAKVGDEETREQFAIDYAAGGELAISDTEPGELEELRGSVSRRLFSLAVVPWKLDVPFAGCDACTGCPHNSTTNPGLFDHGGYVSREMKGGIGDGYGPEANNKPEQAAGVCTNHVCYEAKIRAARAAVGAAAKRVEEKKDPTDTQLSILKPAAIKERVEERKQLRKSRSKTTRDLGPSPERLERRRQEDARLKLNDALQKRVGSTEKLVLAKLAKTPGQWALLKLLMCTKDFERTHHHDKVKAQKAAAAPGMKSLLQALTSPSWESLLQIEQQCGRRFGLFSDWHDGPSGMADAIAEVLGIEQEPAPTLDQFLEADKPAEKAAKRKRAEPVDSDDEAVEDEE